MSTLTRIQEVLGQITGSEYLSLKKIEDGNFKGHVVTLDPANLKAIDIDVWTPGSSGPVLGAERWVDAEYTNEWVYSDGTTSTITFGPSGPENGPSGSYAMPVVYRASGETYDAMSMYMGSYDDSTESDKIVKMEFNDSDSGEVSLTIYRKYTPGHWENEETGEWINGSWGAWKNVNGGPLVAASDIVYNNGKWYWNNSYEAEMDSTYFIPSGENAIIISFADYSTSRTWNNTKPAPAA